MGCDGDGGDGGAEGEFVGVSLDGEEWFAGDAGGLLDVWDGDDGLSVDGGGVRCGEGDGVLVVECGWCGGCGQGGCGGEKEEHDGYIGEGMVLHI